MQTPENLNTQFLQFLTNQIKGDMNIELTVTKEFKVSKLFVEAGVRYWEDATVNGIEDVNGRLIPCRNGGIWDLIIDVDSGRIENWNQGAEAEVNYKVCDCCSWSLHDSQMREIISHENEYVPKFLSPMGNGYGDYIKMVINSEGYIQNWNPEDIKAYYSD